MHLEMLRAQLGEDCTQRTGRILKVMESCIRRQEKGLYPGFPKG
jgi:hypothetical protein